MTKVYEINDGRIWDVEKAAFVDEMPESAEILSLSNADGDIDVDYLRETLLFYGYDLGELASPQELFASLRDERDNRLDEYDKKIAQLDRLIRLNPDDESYIAQRHEWDEYAVALCDLPDEEGAPWDGGGKLTPWPQKPVITKLSTNS